MNKEKEVRKVKGKLQNIGIKLRVISYIGNEKFVKEKEIFSIRQFYNIINKIKKGNLIYGVGVEDGCLVVHLFLDRPTTNYRDEIKEHFVRGG